MTWEKIIESSLMDLDNYLKNSNWFGRENEVVNLFAHKFLAQHLGQKPLISLTQIGIEVAVKQVRDKNRRKKVVRKDLVLWSIEDQTVWRSHKNAFNVPAAIIEWKIDNETNCKYDIDWLTKYTSENGDCLGYSVCVHMKHTIDIVIIKIRNGQVI